MIKYRIILQSIIFLFLFTGFSYSQTKYNIYADKELLADRAIQLALQDIIKLGKTLGLTFRIATDQEKLTENAVLIGTPQRNSLTAELVKDGGIKFAGMAEPQGYEIITSSSAKGKIIVIAGGSLIGDVNGIYWLWDRLRVYKTLPDINIQREPACQIRYTRIYVQNQDDIHRALRYGLNLVYIREILSLIPWDSAPEKEENRKNRVKAKELIDYAHSLHMQVLAFGTDFTYHPSLLNAFNATLSPCDTNFWRVVQEKYRMLLRSLPELDGVAIFTGEEQSYWGDYQTFDPMHEGVGCDWSLEKRYRTFVNKVYQVVVGEFNKIYHHRTWITNCYEQQSRPEVYRKIFTEEVPYKNLYLIPSFTQNDRWWHQRYNPTFNVTPHNMLAVLEPMNYYESSKSNLFPTYPGQYFQAGLQSILEIENSNLKGVSFDLRASDDYNTSNLTAYTVFRLSWDYIESPKDIARDFCAIHFGNEVADTMAEIYLLSPNAYKYGLFIEPVAYGEFNSLPHIRVGTFPVQGYPSIDNGKEHMDFLRKIYLRCKPWIPETISYLNHGLTIANTMVQKYQSIKAQISDRDLANDIENRLLMTRLFIETNNLYVKATFAYFKYWDNPNHENKDQLDSLMSRLKNTRTEFSQLPGFGYHLFGVDQLLLNMEQILANKDEAVRRLMNAPSPPEIEAAIRDQQAKYKLIFSQYPDECIKLLYWEGRVDGRDIIKIQGNHVEIEHLRWDPIYFSKYDISNVLPEKDVTVIVKDINSRPMHPFILEQPSSVNNYTTKIYLYDVPGGAGWCKFQLYYLNKSPQSLGIEDIGKF